MRSVYSNRVRPSDNTPKVEDERFLHNSVEQWKKFQWQIRSSLSDDTPFLLATDIAHFFDRIRVDSLEAELKKLAQRAPTADRERVHTAITMAATLLSRLSGINGGTGIPQNHDASSVLGNLFLNEVDLAMTNELPGRYFRFMDDIRIICTSKTEAQRALITLSSRLAELGNLSLNDAKTHILHRTADSSALAEFLPSQDPVKGPRIEQIDHLLASGSPRGGQIAVQMTLQLFKELFCYPHQFGRIHSRYLTFTISRLSRFARQPFLESIVDWREPIKLLIQSFDDYPWTSQEVIILLLAIETKHFSDTDFNSLVDLVTSEDRALYDWQKYHILLILARHKHASDALAAHALKAVREPTAAKPGLTAGSCIYLVSLNHAQYQGEVLRSLRDGKITDPLGQRAATVALRKLPLDGEVLRHLSPAIRIGHQVLFDPDANEFVAPLPPLRLDQVLRSLPNIISGP